MKMVYCNFDMLSEKVLPKFYDKAIQLMQEADHCAFTSERELFKYEKMVSCALDEDKPHGHPSHVTVHGRPESNGKIVLYDGPHAIAYLEYQAIKRFLVVKTTTKAVDVSDDYETEGKPWE